MSEDINSQNTKRTSAPSKSWMYLVIVIFVVSGFGYFSFVNFKESVTNYDYYRVLSEVTEDFNNRIKQMNSMHTYGESVTAIRAIYPNYIRNKCTTTSKPNGNEPPSCGPHFKTTTKFQYELKAQKLYTYSRDFSARLSISKLLPIPSSGFSKYLLTDKAGKVLTSVGDEKSISIVNLDSVSEELLRQNKQFKFNLSEGEAESEPQTAPLPSHSSHVDLTLSHGEFRAFIFPFRLSTTVTRQTKAGGQAANEVLDQLYFVGLLPKSELVTKGTGHWNISWLLVSFFSVIFFLALARLFLMPKDKSLSRFFRYSTLLGSYVFFVAVVSLIIAYMEMQALSLDKDVKAKNFAKSQSAALSSDLENTFNKLDGFRAFYKALSVMSYKVENIDELNSVKTSLQKLAKASKTSSGQDYLSNGAEKVPLSILNAQLNKFELSFKEALALLEPLSDSTLGLHQIASTHGVHDLGDVVLSREEKVELFVSIMSENIEIDYKLLSPLVVLGKGLNFKIERDKTGLPVASSIDKKGNTNSQDRTLEVLNVSSFLNTAELGETSIQRPNIFNVIALNGKGYTAFPRIEYTEVNTPPFAYFVPSRNYFKYVRDQKGWTLKFEDNPRENVYVQRLRNLNNGTRGTTISMPLFTKQELSQNNIQSDHVVAADVILPSMSLSKPPNLDFTFMVIDRNTGSVLFHNDDSRSLVENIFYSGNSGSDLSQQIKAGLDYSRGNEINFIEGHYHGQPGRFVIEKTVVDAWSIVVFYPDDSLKALMTNQFLYVWTTLSFVLLMLFICVEVFKQFRGRLEDYRYATCSNSECHVGTLTLHHDSADSHHKNCKARKLTLFEKVGHIILVNTPDLRTREVMLSGSVLLAAVYFVYHAGLLIDASIGDVGVYSNFLSLLICIGTFLLLNIVGFRLLNFSNKKQNRLEKHSDKLMQFTVLMAPFVLIQVLYLSVSADLPLRATVNHYNTLQDNWKNHELTEIRNKALSLFPNSITKERIDPLCLMPLDKPENAESCKSPHFSRGDIFGQNNLGSKEILPKDYPTLVTITGTKFIWRWINEFVLNGENENGDADVLADIDIELSVGQLFASILVFILTLITWVAFNKTVLSNRLYCSSQFLSYVNGLSRIYRNSEDDRPAENKSIRTEALEITCVMAQFNGVGLDFLLGQSARFDFVESELHQQFQEVLNLSPCLLAFQTEGVSLPNLKIQMNGEGQDLEITISDLDTCIETYSRRSNLLLLINDFKSLALDNRIKSFRILAGFHSIQRLEMRDSILPITDEADNNGEYLAWAECMMDFGVNVPDSMSDTVDLGLLQEEVKFLPELNYLLDRIEVRQKLHPKKTRHFTDKWATINYVLLHAEAAYRFRWGQCTSSEKLALFNLASKKNLNPMNVQMIEHLAMNGLVKVKDGSLKLINESFESFVLNAESTEDMSALIQKGESGLWKSYRGPIAALALLLIVGIALTSGESVFIIAASVAGLLGTIAGIVNSANMLKGS